MVIDPNLLSCNPTRWCPYTTPQIWDSKSKVEILRWMEPLELLRHYWKEPTESRDVAPCIYKYGDFYVITKFTHSSVAERVVLVRWNEVCYLPRGNCDYILNTYSNFAYSLRGNERQVFPTTPPIRSYNVSATVARPENFAIGNDMVDRGNFQSDGASPI